MRDQDSGSSEKTDAGFGPRLGALLLDSTILGILGIFTFGIGAAAYAVAYLVMTAITGHSLGKMALRIRVVNDRGDPPGFGRTLLREVVGKAISTATLFLGYLWVLADREHRALHDHLGGTWVVRLVPCHACGAGNAPQKAACTRCGRPLAGGTPVAAPLTPPPTATGARAAFAVPAPHQDTNACRACGRPFARTPPLAPRNPNPSPLLSRGQEPGPPNVIRGLGVPLVLPPASGEGARGRGFATFCTRCGNRLVISMNEWPFGPPPGVA